MIFKNSFYFSNFKMFCNEYVWFFRWGTKSIDFIYLIV